VLAYFLAEHLQLTFAALVLLNLLGTCAWNYWLGSAELRDWSHAPRLPLGAYLRLKARQTPLAQLHFVLVLYLLVMLTGVSLTFSSRMPEIGFLLLGIGAFYVGLQWRVLWLARREPQPQPAADEPDDGSARDVTGGIHEQS
jgi:hypothetical protein